MPVSTDQLQETLAECLTHARSDLIESQTDALQTLSSLTKLSSHHHLLMQNPAAISTIISLSRSYSPPVQTLALSILFNLSLNLTLKQTLAKQVEIIYHLNSLILSPPSPQIGKLAASLICSLAVLDKNKAAFGVAGTIESIVKALKNTSDHHHLLSSLMELVQFHGNSTLAVRAGAVPMLVDILNGSAEELKGTSLAILALLARYEEGVRAIMVVEGVVRLLLEGLRRGCMMSRESAAEILIRLLKGSESLMVEAAASPELCSLLADLSIRGSTKAREKAGILMKMMMEADLDCFLEGGGSPLL